MTPLKAIRRSLALRIRGGPSDLRAASNRNRQRNRELLHALRPLASAAVFASQRALRSRGDGRRAEALRKGNFMCVTETRSYQD